MATHMKKHKIKWSTGALLVMMVSCVVYGFAEVWTFNRFGVFLPSEYTYLFAAVFVSEVAAMAAIKVNKEQAPNRNLESIGVYGSELAQVAQAEQDPDSTQPINDGQGVG